MKLYHATIESNADKIRQEGLKRGKPANYDGMYMQNYLYFAFNPECAISYVETSDNYNGDEIVVFEIDTKDMDIEKMTYDWNNYCEYHNNINSLAYDDDISISLLKELTDEEIKNIEEIEFDDLRYIDDDSQEIWDGLLSVFEEEVLSNKEMEYDE